MRDGGKQVELRGEGSIHISGVPGRSEDMPGEGYGVLADEESGFGCVEAVQGGAGILGGCGAGIHGSFDIEDEMWFSGEN
ncbi:hypothetical protein LOK49_LG12G01402 [Camellia lanceoleosa]|uniref:Uncharacterized protein n=1 Tax=Camellia lanceoleosa TaxID=1840588 RepID=A0ACC0FT17_9ERIC|nr:hypothetical protein LOK49_LG12G01402 [Camellia lanceoleosa]